VNGLDRDSSVTLRAMLKLPPKRFRLFMVASIVGTWIPQSGGTGRPLRNGQRAVAIEIVPATRTRILEELGYTRKTWDNAVRDWIYARLAHRCERGVRGVVCLFITPLGGVGAICPRCKVQLGGHGRPVEGTNTSSWGDFGQADSNRATSNNGDGGTKVKEQGEGEGGKHNQAGPPQRTALQEVLEEEEALARFRAAFPEAKDIS
jgi:hypothetical protein